MYVSDTKVDMLYSQIPSSWRDKLAGELKIDLQLLSVSLKEDPRDENRFSKAALVADYIRQHLSVGSAHSPREYFTDTLPMRGTNLRHRSRLLCL